MRRLEAELSIRDTPTTFSAEEAADISRAAKDPQGHPICPRCGTDMELGPTINKGGTTAQEIVCPTCQRCVMVSHHGDWGSR